MLEDKAKSMHRSLVFLDRSILTLIIMMMSKLIDNYDCDNFDEDENRGGDTWIVAGVPSSLLAARSRRLERI